MTLIRSWIGRCICVCFALACLSGILAAQTRMGLVGPGVGWASVSQGTVYSPNDHLFWTSDDGRAWADITPHDPASRQIAGVFFLDASRGWVLFALKREPPKNNQEPDNFITDIRGFDLATTTDGGTNWIIKHLDSLSEGVGWLAASEIFFLDAAHGWMNIQSPVPHWGGEGILLATADGGNTWKAIVEVSGGGGYGPIRFTDLQNGWIAGGPGDDYLYATNDGGRHWREVAVPAPPPISGLFEDVAAQYALPRFTDALHGFLAVKYNGPDKSGDGINIQAALSTNDGGSTWHLESWSNLNQAANFPIVAVVDSTIVTPKRLDQKPLTLLKLAPGGKLTETRASESPEVSSGAALLSLNFSDGGHGWASWSNGRLLSTTDGGLTWKDITPGRKKMSLAAPSNAIPSNSSSDIALQSSLVAPPAPGLAAGSAIATYKSRHLGFDLCQAPDTGPMATWWTSSPYFDIGIYVGGSTRSCPQPLLTSSWIKTITGQGWGLISLWPGPQAPCTCPPNKGTWPNCTQNWASTISTTGGAYAQGQAEADAATNGTRSAMQKLGLGVGSVIYFDIENYTPSATCSGNPTGSYVNSFLSGWVSEIQHNGYIAGVYGNPAPASTWSAGGTGYTPVSPSPSDVFIAKQDNRVTIWGLTTLTDTAWPQDQRIHQWGGPHNETWGNQLFNIDSDIEDADVTGGKGAKTYSFSYDTTLDYFGAGYTYPWGINNSGQIIGQYVDPTTGLYHGFLNSYGTITSLDCQGAVQTFPYGINNIGQIVGYYIDQLQVGHGFLYQAGVCSNIDYNGATATYAFGINDDDQISGYYVDSLGVDHGFQYQPGTGTFSPPIDYPGASGTVLFGINGDAQIAGYCQQDDCPGFLYAQGAFVYPPVAVADSVNNNEQVTGGTAGTILIVHEGSSTVIACPNSSMTNPVLSTTDFILNAPVPPTQAKVAFVGSCVLSATGVLHGFLATSQ